MSDLIRAYYEHAQLSDAAYAELFVGMALPDYIQELKNRGFGSRQATEFVNRYSIASAFSDIATGFSATLFQRTGTNEKILAIRGTNDVVDFLTSNLQIGLLGMASQYTSLNTFYLQLIVEGKLFSTDQLTVSGHSLGGYLAQAFTVDHPLPVSHAYTYNAPGFGGVLINPFGSLGVAGTSIPDSLITNMIAQGHSFVASQGRQIGEPEHVFIETTLNPLTNHGIRSLVDTLALYDLVARIDSTVSVSAVTNILNAVSVTAANSLENGLDALRKVFQGSTVTPTSEGDRNAFYSNLIALRDSLPATSLDRLESLLEASSSTIYGQANSSTTDGLAYRYALRELNPFAVIGADYILHNTDGSLDLYDAQTGNGTMTAVYLSDRAELLTKRLAVNVNDGGSVPTDTHFVDVRTGFEVGSVASTNEVIFGDTQDNRDLLGHGGGDHLYGGEGNDLLSGQGGIDYLEGNQGNDDLYGGSANDILFGQQGNDQLYGEADNDRLNGGLGNDRLEGGAGLDTYFYWSGQGNDTIMDSDRLGVIRFNNQILQGGLNRSTDPVNTYRSLDGQFTYVRQGNNLVINTALTIENFDFQNGTLGIKLAEAPETTLPAVPTINYGSNGFASEEVNLPASGAWIIERVEPVNYIFNGGQGSYRIYAGFGNDQLYGGPLFDRLSSRGGNDLLEGFAGNDELYGWEGDDILQGGEGADLLYGDLTLTQAGHDYLDGGDGDDFMVGGSGDDVLIGGSGNDMLWAEGGTTELTIIPPGDPNQTGFSFTMDYSLGSGRDTLDGGAGNDALVGFASADVLLGGDGTDVLVGDYNGATTSVTWDPAQDGEDYLDGGAGNDTLYGGGLADVLIGGSGDDIVFGEGLSYGAPAGEDWLEGGEGNDQLYAGLGADALFGGTGDDLLVGDYENEPGADDTLDGGAGIDELQGGGGHDLLVGGTENDRLFGQDGDDSLSGDAGDDELQGGTGEDGLFGGTGNDSLFGQDGADVLDGEEGNDLVKGGEGNDTLFGGDGIDELQGGNGDDELAGETGNDFLYGDGNDPTILNLIGGDDTLDGEEGDDQLWGGAGQDLLFGGGGVDQLVGEVGNDQLYGEDGDDSLLGDSPFFPTEVGSDFLDGGAGNDVLQGGGGDDQLEGGSGDDVLVGEFWDVPAATAGDDDLHGGAGNDRLIGGAGSDTYRFNLGDGIDSVEDVGGQNNRLVFGTGIIADSLSLDVAAGDSLVVRVGNNGDAVQIAGYGVGSAPEFYSINRFEFADGTALTDSQLLARGFHLSAPVDGGTLHGTAFADHMQGSQTDDWFYGRDGNDVLTGGQGDDVLEGEEGDDELDGGAGNDRLYGSAGSNVLRGGEGNDLLESAGVGDQLFGGAGDDSYQLWSVLQTIVEDVNAGTDTIHLAPTASLTFQTPDHVENVQIQDDFSLDPTMHVDLVGNTLDNQLSGSHRLDGREGNDTLVGSGDNTFVFGRGYGCDTVRTGTQWYAHTGLDQVVFLSDIAPAVLVLENHANDLVVRINGTTDQLTVESYFVSPINRVDQFVFAEGTVWSLNDIEDRVLTFVGSEADDTFYGTSGDDTIRGLGGNDQIRASLGNDLLDGGEGNDYLEGYIGNDIYVFGRGYGQDSIDEQGDSSDVDTLQLADGIAPGDITLRATPDFSSDVFLSINDTNDQLSLGGFFAFESLRVDLIQFADGIIWDYSTMLARVEGVNLAGTDEVDYLSGNVTNDILSGLGGDDSLYGGAANDTLLGGSGADLLDGGTGNDILDGGTGADTMIGGAGNDLYVVDGIGDTVMEQAGQGTDTVQNSLTYTLGANVENLTLTGSAAINGTGNARNNTLIGNWAANVLTGGSGNDTYIVGAGDSVIEASSGGTDTVQTDITWILGANIERLVLTGTAAINGTGNSLANTLIGNSAANTLNGGAGVDTLIGGQGDDRYIVDNTSDKTTEGANEGLDTVQSSVSYTLAANVENLALTGTGVINGTGNGLDNVLVGNSAANRLTGGAGSDTYVIGAGDSIVEAVNAGIDSVQSSATHTIAANVENMTLTGTAAINGTGNGLNNILIGNSAANTLTGGAGNDTYVVGMGDTVVEALNAGTDTVQSSVTWTLGANVENLSLTGSEAINGTGNTLANVLIGNGGNNALAGGDGNDTLTGGQGNDVLNGGIGNDVFQFARGDGQDTVTDTSGPSDRLNFGSGIDPLDLMLSRSADDLRIALYGSNDQVTIANWYGGATNQLEAVQAGNDQQLMNTQVDQLIQAMAGFTQQTGLSWEQAVAQRPQDVQQILAANWQ